MDIVAWDAYSRVHSKGTSCADVMSPVLEVCLSIWLHADFGQHDSLQAIAGLICTAMCFWKLLPDCLTKMPATGSCVQKTSMR